MAVQKIFTAVMLMMQMGLHTDKCYMAYRHIVRMLCCLHADAHPPVLLGGDAQRRDWARGRRQRLCRVRPSSAHVEVEEDQDEREREGQLDIGPDSRGWLGAVQPTTTVVTAE